MEFRTFLQELEGWDRLYESEADDARILNHQPKDGKWSPPLEQNADYYTFKFNVPSDDCGPANPCYSAEMSLRSDGASFGFSRQGSHTDQNRGVGMDVFKGVLYALGKFIVTKQPRRLSWSAVRKSTINPKLGMVTNADARASVYEKWATRNLFPNRYVGMDGKWIRRDVYDNEFVPTGYPPIPEGLTGESSPHEKAKVLEMLQQKVIDNREEINRQSREREELEARRRQEEEERRRATELERQLREPEINTEGLQVGDLVYNEEREQVYKIAGFQLNRQESVRVQCHKVMPDGSIDEEIYSFSFNDLKKEHPHSAGEREQAKEQRKREILADRTKNPHGIQVGDNVVTVLDGHPESNQNGLLGVVKDFNISRWGDVSAIVDFDDHGKQIIGAQNVGKPISLSFFRKATTENILAIRRRIHEKDINQKIERGRRRNAAPEAIEETPPEIVNHPNNPLHLKIGDHVKVNDYRSRGRTAVIADLRIQWGDHLSAYVRFHGSKAANPTRVWSMSDLERDTGSPQSQQAMARRQAALDRAQRIAAQNPQGIQIGDTITVVSGINSRKTGRVTGFRSQGANLYVSVIDPDNHAFTANIRVVVKNNEPPAAANAATA